MDKLKSALKQLKYEVWNENQERYVKLADVAALVDEAPAQSVSVAGAGDLRIALGAALYLRGKGTAEDDRAILDAILPVLAQREAEVISVAEEAGVKAGYAASESGLGWNELQRRGFFKGALARVVKEAVEAEREQCAEVADRRAKWFPQCKIAPVIAGEIRIRASQGASPQTEKKARI